MYFDMLAGLAERHMLKIIPLLKAAKVFSFPGRAHEFLPKTFTKENIEFMLNTFILPFTVVAIEDTGSVVVLADSYKNQVGVLDNRIFIECLSLSTKSTEFRKIDSYHETRFKELQETFDRETCLVTIGSIRFPSIGKTDYTVDGAVSNISILNKKEVIAKMTNLPDEVVKESLKNAATAFEEILYFNSPDRFILESRPVKQKRSKLQIARLHERSLYTILTPKEIRSKMQISQHSDRKVRPHERRRHRRKFRNEKFVKMRGKTIIIPATWVGDVEKRIGNKIYRVRLDL